MRKCPCTVLIVKPTEQEHFGVIAAAVDRDGDSPENHLLNLRILKHAAWVATAESSELHIVHAWSLPFESLLKRSGHPEEEFDAMVEQEETERIQWLHELLEELAQDSSNALNCLSPKIHAVDGDPYFKIPAKLLELKADLIVMGTVGRVGVQGLLMGNTSEAILRNAECSVLTIKPPGFESPLSA